MVVFRISYVKSIIDSFFLFVETNGSNIQRSKNNKRPRLIKSLYIIKSRDFRDVKTSFLNQRYTNSGNKFLGIDQPSYLFFQ